MIKNELFLQEEQAKVFKCLAHPMRIAILQILGGGEACVCHMEAVLGVRQAYLSQQLGVLRENGLIIDRKDGWNVFYQLKDERVIHVLNSMNTLIPEKKLSPLDLIPEKCSCPKCSNHSQETNRCNQFTTGD